MATDDQIYESNKVRTLTRFGTILALILTTGAVGGMHLYLHRPVVPETPQPVQPAPKPLITADECTKMCSELGVAHYDLQGCVCRTPTPVPTPVVGKMICECREVTSEEQKKMNHY